MASGRARPSVRRGATGFGLAALNRLSGAAALDRLGLRRPVDKAVYEATRAGFTTAAAASRAFARVRGAGAPSRPAAAAGGDLFDLTPTEEQRMIRETVAEFAAERLRPAASAADTACAAPDGLLAAAAGLGVTSLAVPERFGGLGGERSAVTGVLVAEAMAHGDMGLALACLAPCAVSTALALWGHADQQATYLPSFTGDDVPAAALAIQEPRPLFDPFTLRTTARRTPGGYVLDGEKSVVPLAAGAELFVVAARLEGCGPALLLAESGTPGLTVAAEPSMGLRAAGLGRLVLDHATVPATALLGGTEAGTEAAADVYTECVRLSRLAWSALAVGTSQAVLDHVVPYVNERVAFGEPIANRQGVAFKVADIAIELEGMRLLTYRAASRVEQGLPAAREIALARRLCADKGMAIGSDGVQLLGGHGYVKEHPVERWYRDLRAIGLMEGAVLV